MAEKRFGIIKTKTYGLYVPVDKMKVYNFSGFESELDCIRVVDALNELDSENQKLKNENEQLKMHMKSAKAHLEGEHTKKAIERLQIADR